MKDRLEYKDSISNRFFIEARLTKIPSLNVTNNVKYEVNWQRERSFRNGSYQDEDRIGLLTMVSKADYTWRLGKLWITPQLKLMFLKRVRRSLDFAVDYERYFIPILRFDYFITQKTLIRAGIQGFPGLEYEYTDFIDNINSFKMRTSIFSVSNVSRYFGYNIVTNLGIMFEKRDYADPQRGYEDYDYSNAFLRVILGY